MVENACILVKEIDCDNVLLITENPTTVIDTSDPVVVVVDDGNTSVNEAGEDLSIIVRDESTTVIEQSDPVVVIVACEQGPAGADGADGIGVVEISSGPVSNGSTVTADSVAVAAIRSVKWLVTLTDSTGTLYKFYEVIAIHDGTTALHSVYGLVGDSISVSNDVDINAGLMRLRITNNHANDLDIKVLRIVTTL